MDTALSLFSDQLLILVVAEARLEDDISSSVPVDLCSKRGGAVAPPWRSDASVSSFGGSSWQQFVEAALFSVLAGR